MPFYNHMEDWNGLQVQAIPTNPWRKRFPFWPFFVGQRIQFDLVVTKPGGFEKGDLNFHFVEKMTDADKPRMVAPIPLQDESSAEVEVFRLQDGSKITSKGEIHYWLSNRGYNVDREPIFAAEAVCLDSMIIPTLFGLIVPLFALIIGLVLGLLIGG